MSTAPNSVGWQWENATAGAVAGLATVTFSHPLDVGFRGLYAGFYPAVLGSTISWGLYFFFYSKAKQRYSRDRKELSPGLHLASAAEAGALVCLCTNPVWLVKTRLQLQTPQLHTRPYSGFHDQHHYPHQPTSSPAQIIHQHHQR
ncbi:hypothetical protein RJ640_011186 [Escallonia rubra]|uniref:Uncharacterized protein n=1 Tax=Escallonia rubra TaxID=112253 RepID=A0AA88RIP5_9ASTE|nr:hypothetical protein RJ640_011186 [Escallonia rubra]